VEVGEVEALMIEGSQTLIETGKSIDVMVVARDRRLSKEFNSHQYKYMNIKLYVIKGESLEGVEVFAPEEDTGRRFSLIGRQPGQYFLQAQMRRRDQSWVKSNIFEIEVFVQLKAEPAALLLAPGCSTSIRLSGGPAVSSRVQLNYLASQPGAVLLFQLSDLLVRVQAVAPTTGSMEVSFWIT